MINIPSLEILAAHGAGDFILQSQWMAANKLTNPLARLWHVVVYTACFIPTLAFSGLSVEQLLLTLLLIAGPHYVLDSRRWASGDTWPPKPIMVDQVLHLIHLALLMRWLSSL